MRDQEHSHQLKHACSILFSLRMWLWTLQAQIKFHGDRGLISHSHYQLASAQS